MIAREIVRDGAGAFVERPVRHEVRLVGGREGSPHVCHDVSSAACDVPYAHFIDQPVKERSERMLGPRRDGGNRDFCDVGEALARKA